MEKINKEQVKERLANPTTVYIWKTPCYLPEGHPGVNPSTEHEPFETNYHLGFIKGRENGERGIYIHSIHRGIYDLAGELQRLKKSGEIAKIRNEVDPFEMSEMEYQYGGLEHITKNYGFLPLNKKEKSRLKRLMEKEVPIGIFDFVLDREELKSWPPVLKSQSTYVINNQPYKVKWRHEGTYDSNLILRAMEDARNVFNKMFAEGNEPLLMRVKIYDGGRIEIKSE